MSSKVFSTYYLQKYIDFVTNDTLLSNQTLMLGWWAEPVAVLAQWRWKRMESSAEYWLDSETSSCFLETSGLWLCYFFRKEKGVWQDCVGAHTWLFSLRLLWENEQHHRPLSIPWISPAQVSPLVTSAMTSVLIVRVFNTYVVCSWGNADRCSSKPRCHFCKEKKQTAWRRRQQKHRQVNS